MIKNGIIAKNTDPVRIELGPAAPNESGEQETWFTSTANFINENKEVTKHAYTWVQERKKNFRSGVEFFNFSKFGFPSLTGAIPRINKNLDYFFTNYLCVFFGLLIFSIFIHWLVLLTMIALVGLLYTIYQKANKGPIVIYGCTVPPGLLYSLTIMFSIPWLYLSGASNILIWAFGLGSILVFAHATFYANEEIPGAEFEKDPVRPEV